MPDSAAAPDGHAVMEAQLQRMAGLLLSVSPDRSFLEPLARQLVGDAVGEPATLRAALAEADARLEKQLSAHAESSPLALLMARHQLSRLESDLLLLSLLPELDDRFASLFLSLRGGVAPGRPTLGLALRALLGERDVRWHARRHLVGSALWEAGLLTRETPGTPTLESVLKPCATVVAAVHGHLPEYLEGGLAVEWDTPASPGSVPRPALEALARETVRWLSVAPTGRVHVSAEDFSGARALVREVARALGRPLLKVSGPPALLGPAMREAELCALLAGGVVCLEVERSAEPLHLPVPWKPSGPLLVVSPLAAEVHLPEALPGRHLVVRRPRPREQAEVWRRELAAVEGSARVELLANRTFLTAEDIARVTRLAAQRALAEGRAGPVHEDVAAALDEALPEPASPLARTTRPKVSWTQLVLERRTKGQLEDLVVRVQHRLTVQEEWGMAGSEGRGEGLIALLHGESGTGKTLGAEAVAARLGLPMMRVDLSRVVSKYIGETEKHLGGLFDAAEGFRAVLFFDEADTLFGSRTAVKDAHDRYANLETNYLLSRLEAFEGVAVLATNLLKNVDDAFTRRIQFIVHFPPPGPSLQRQIWLQHLPRERLAEGVDLEALVRQQDMVGGEIRNAAQTAAYAAAAQGTAITQTMLEEAVRAERVKWGKTVRRESGEASRR
jgi:hypothetical protein